MIEHLEEVAEHIWTVRHPHGPTWSEVKDFPRGEKYRDVSRAAIAALSVIQKDMVIVPREALEPFEREAKEWPAHTGTFDISMNASRTSFYTTKFTAEDLRAVAAMLSVVE